MTRWIRAHQPRSNRKNRNSYKRFARDTASKLATQRSLVTSARTIDRYLRGVHVLQSRPATEESEHASFRRAAPIDELRRMDPSQALLVYGAEIPALVKLRPWYSARMS